MKLTILKYVISIFLFSCKIHSNTHCLKRFWNYGELRAYENVWMISKQKMSLEKLLVIHIVGDLGMMVH